VELSKCACKQADFDDTASLTAAQIGTTAHEDTVLKSNIQHTHRTNFENTTHPTATQIGTTAYEDTFKIEDSAYASLKL
jgi:hypothetical protein